jgi:hypothetical protein
VIKGAEIMSEEAADAAPPQDADDDEDQSGSLHSESPELDEFFSTQVGERDNSFYKSLLEGFQTLKEGDRENKKKPLFALDPTETVEPTPKNEGAIKTFVTVNFIDPTTKPEGTHTPKATNMMSPQNNKTTATAPVIENVYEKLSYIFERDYKSTLRSVQYKNMRSGESDVISSIPVQTILTRTGGGTANGDANVPWGGTAGTPAATVSDPSEWHNGSYCHVYVAACESLEHYRTKVRPSLQAYVSQIESAASGSAAGSSTSSHGASSAHYLIVYVPTGPKDAAGVEESSVTSGPVRRALANRFQKLRAFQKNDSGELDTSLHSRDSLASEDALSDTEDLDSAAVSLNLLTKNERAIYKKISSDFSGGKVCVLSVSSLDQSDDESAISSAGFAIRTQEWNSFNRMLGSVIVCGFKDRCRRYNDELRRLDAQRATAATAAKSGNKGGKTKAPPAVFNLSHFFLIKESLAFTYEQMQLPAEALLQYDEFRAFLPDLTDKEHKKALKARRKSKALTDDSSPPLVELADAGDFVGFRRKIRSEFDLTPILDIMRRYLFARELFLLFKMEQPVELISRCEAFSKLMYSIMVRGLSERSPEEQQKRKVEAAKWVIQFSWDAKCTCEYFLTAFIEARQSIGDSMSVDTMGSDVLSDSSDLTQSEQAVASRLGELLEVSRLLLKELGDTELDGPNPIRVYETKLPEDMFRPWQPWQEPVESTEGDSKNEETAGVSGKNVSGRSFLLENAFSSPEEFEHTYLDLAGAIVHLSRFGHRRRLASRLQGEIAEHYVRKGDLKAAAVVFKKIVKIYKSDQWDHCHFWRLFRLAHCQRTTAQVTDYLKTLVTCFSPRTAVIAPTKALNALQDDLEVIIGHPVVGKTKYSKLAFIETEMQILETSSDESTLGTGVDRKQLLKRYCSVGENVRILISLTSYLPRAIELNSLKLFIVSFATFSSIIENRESVEEEDAFRILELDTSGMLEPGKNTFTLDWAPSGAGQYILSTIEIVWKEGFFYYDSMDLPAPLLGVDVLPSEPTHSLSLDPGYLVPGHDQQVQITFDAGSDFVTAGKILLSCSDGLTLIPPGEDPGDGNWKKEFEIKLEPRKPGEKTVLTTHVRCGLIEKFSHDSISEVPSLDTAHGLSAKAFTSYLHAETEGSGHSDIPNMRTALEAVAPILEKTALSVESVDAIWTTPGDRAMLSINLMSNTPAHFSVEEWNLELPSPLKVAEDVDLNGDLLKCTVTDGDQLALAFDCIVIEEKETKSSDTPMLQVKLRDDVGKVFSLALSLDLNDFYLKLWDSQTTPKASITVTAALRLDANEGNVGAPVMMTFAVESGGLKTDDRDLVYSIVWEGSDWLVGGKVNGIMDRSGPSASCELVGIPAAPGLLSRFPKISLGFSSGNGRLTPLKVKLQHPQAFRSFSKTSEVGIAFPTNKIAV